jgi:hypothetical protein
MTMIERDAVTLDETMGQQLIDAAHEQSATPDQMAEAAADMAEAALKDASPEERAEVAERITRRLTPLILAAGVDMETVIANRKIEQLRSRGITVNEERIRKVISLRRKPIQN